MVKWFQVLSVPKVITVLCLLGLGANGLVQVGLQKDIAAKSEKLKAQIAETQQLSGNMKNGLNGLTELKESTVHMAGTLRELKTTTSDMDQGLATLDQIVSGINQSVQSIGHSTQQSVNQIQVTQEAARQLLVFLQNISQVNSEVIANLNQMIQDQTTINQNLEEMNRKTDLLPKWGAN